jgi:mannose-1-phosphate guanylyltransferase
LERNRHTWAVVLAGGEGSRLHSLTRNSQGVAVPKQFCSLFAGPSLLQETMTRALGVAPIERTCVVVAAHHRRWWKSTLKWVPRDNVIVQEEDRGTAHGVLLPIVHILVRDPDAIVAILPADHYLRDELPLRETLRDAEMLAAKSTRDIFLLGIEPDGPDAELGYIVPLEGSKHSPAKVQRFFEKPTMARARQLLDARALWNAFIIVASARALLALLEKRCPETIRKLLAITRRHRSALATAAAIRHLYRELPSIDFSRDILEGQESMLRVLRVPNCGWTDLCTPQRVAQTLHRLPIDLQAVAHRPFGDTSVNLAFQYLHSQSDGERGMSTRAYPAGSHI